MNENKNATIWLVRTAIVAALYVALTLSFSAFSYGAIQFRISEVLVLLPLWDRRWTPGVVLGTVIANFFSPLGFIDVIFGSGATLISIMSMTRVAKLSNKYYSLIIPVIFNGYIIAAELAIVFNAPYWESVVWVAAGEAIIIALGYTFWHFATKNKHLLKIIQPR